MKLSFSVSGNIEITAQEAREFYALDREYKINDKLNDRIDELTEDVEDLNERVCDNESDLIHTIYEMSKQAKSSDTEPDEDFDEESDDEENSK